VHSAELRGTVRDDGGRPLPGAVVSALGATSAFAISDKDGRFTFRALPPGTYLIRAYLEGHLPARGRLVQVGPDGPSTSAIELVRKLERGDAPSVLEASVGASTDSTSPDGAPAAEQRHDHDEVAWRLRHLKRSVLKDAEAAIAELDDDDSALTGSFTSVGRAVGDSARVATEFFSELSLSGQFNLLTTTSFDRPQDLFTLSGGVPQGIAYVALEAPGRNGNWTMRGTMTQGDVASWIVAGSYVRSRPVAHAYQAGVSYALQRYLGASADALTAMRDDSRTVGSVYAMDAWTVAPRLSVSYGGKYARYDYLADRGLISPSATLIMQPSPDDPLKIRATVLHREVAPGAEEFLPPSSGLWLPPERTFSQISRQAFLPERHSQVELSVDREWGDTFVVGVRTFSERVEDQVVTVFNVGVARAAAETGHYEVGSAGDVAARGWGVTVSRSLGDYLRASVDYTSSRTRWLRRSPDAEALAERAPSALRSDERIHDITASVESVVAVSATRLLAVYKLNTGFSATNSTDTTPGPGVRFDVQVNQALPFLNFSSAQWEMLVAVSNLFKETLYENSVYDELLVVRPPKRMLGGVTVRF
jgi:hypothetical protein